MVIIANLVAFGLLVTAGYLAWDRYLKVQEPGSSVTQELAAVVADPNNDSPKVDAAVALSPLNDQPASFTEGITRQIELDTHIPKRPEVDVVTYTVETGNSLFSIAEFLWHRTGNHSVGKFRYPSG